MGELPSGTVTFLFSDIEGSTRLLHEVGDGAYVDVLAQHRQILRAAFVAHNGIEIGTEGDSFFVAFALASDAVAAAVEAQRGLHGGRVRVRMGLHAGEPSLTREGYVGMVVHRAARISAAAHGGQVLLSEAVANLVEHRLPSDIGLRDLGQVRLKDLTKPEHVYQVLHPQLRDSFPALRSLERTPNNLPQQVTSFVGREREQAEVKRLLRTDRLVTLIGAGGLGKTRLSLQVAADVIDDYAGGVWLVEFAPLTEAGLVAQAVASVLGVKETAGRPLIEALMQHVKDRPLLLLLDNCEHLRPACAELTKRLLQAGEHLKVLATSRERLHVSGETTYLLAPLSVPGLQQTVTVEALTQYEAVRLFIARALAARPTFQASLRNLSAVADICRHLDGIPLALELAAARVGALSVENIAVRLGDCFRLLTHGDQTELPRQQTMRACIDWSYDLLSELERELLRRLTVFTRWTLDAAEAVVVGGEITPSGVLELLTNLVEKSLVVLEEEGKHYRLLETVRQYARERLQESGEEALWRGRHLAYFLNLAEHAAGPAWTERLAEEAENLRAALAWSLDESIENDAALRFCGALYQFWWRSGRASEGCDWCNAALARRPGANVTTVRAKALRAAGVMYYSVGDLVNARRLHDEALVLSHKLGDVSLETLTLTSLANVELSLGHMVVAQQLYERSIELCRQLGDLNAEASYLNCLATLFVNEGNLAAAKAPLERALLTSRQVDNREQEAYTLKLLGGVAQYQGDVDIAQERYHQALVIARELGLRELESEQLRHLAEVSVVKCEFGVARTLLWEALTLSRKQGSWFAIRECFDAIAALATATHEYKEAVKFLGCVEKMRVTSSAPRFPVDQERFQANLMQCRVALGDDACDRAIAEAHQMRSDCAIDSALAWLSGLESSS